MVPRNKYFKRKRVEKKLSWNIKKNSHTRYIIIYGAQGSPPGSASLVGPITNNSRVAQERHINSRMNEVRTNFEGIITASIHH